MSLKPSKVEIAKEDSRRLRGTVQKRLEAQAESFEHDDIQILKFHGIYQQDDRDQRAARRKAGEDKAFKFMVRARIPGGRVTAQQWLAFDDIEKQLDTGRGLRLTSRQAVQWHGLGSRDLVPLLRSINESLLTTLGACGDIGRNVMLSPAPIADEHHEVAQTVASEVARRLELKTGAYHEIWFDGDPIHHDEEPLYGDSYLPRKLKLGVTVAGENSIDVFTQDIGFIVVDDPINGTDLGLLVGGGLGMTHKKADTFARLGSPIGVLTPWQAGEVVEAITEIFRDYGNRSDRRHSRLKYLLEEWGVDRFRKTLERKLGWTLSPWIDPGPFEAFNLLGEQDQKDGNSFYGIWVENGRVDAKTGIRAALRRIAKEIGTDFVLTPTQNIIVTDLDSTKLAKVRSILSELSVVDPTSLSGVRRYAMACPALPTCGLALTDAERVMPEITSDFEKLLQSLGLANESIAIRSTGCPNACARPYSADIGIVGRGPNQYDLYVGGGLEGDRLGELYEEKVPREEIPSVLRPLLEAWSQRRFKRESLGRFYWRVRGGSPRLTLRNGAKTPTRGSLALLSSTLDRSTLDTPQPGKRRSLPMVFSKIQSKRKIFMSEQLTPVVNSIPRLGDSAPDFTAVTTQGQLTLSEWQEKDWVVLFSHPADFTPVCTTELAALARRQDEFTARGVKLIGISIDSIHAHLAWVESIRENLGVEIGYPLVADLNQAVAQSYGLVHPGESETATVRALFVLDPARVVRAVIYYPLNVGRNIDEVLRLVDALQTASQHSVATPVDWKPGDDVVVPPPKTADDVAGRRETEDNVHAFYLHTRPLPTPSAKRPS